jgi:lysophospholipid acyltransferase (LPLAT)-like uncharacterized protein
VNWANLLTESVAKVWQVTRGWTSPVAERMSQAMWRSIRRAGITQGALSLILAAYIVLVRRTTRWNVVNREIVEGVWRDGGPIIGAVWHARVLMTVAAWPKKRNDVQPPKILISMSPDGEFVARAAELLKVGVIRGSSAKAQKQKGGAAAFREMLEHLRNGGCMAITPDGPRGPRMRASLGAIRLAKMSGAPILLYAWSTNRRIVFNSWDRFVLPLPFGRGFILWGGLIHVPHDADLPQLVALQQQLERDLTALTQEADRLAGVPTVQPADPNEKRRTRAHRNQDSNADSDLEMLG